MNLLNKIAVMNGASPVKLLLWRYLTIVLLAGFVIIFKNAYTIDKKRLKISFLSGIVLFVEIVVILEALRLGDFGLVIPLTQISFIFVSVISAFLYKEKLNLKKFAGLILAIIAIILIS